MKQKKRKGLVLAIAICLLLAIFPMSALATTGDTTPPTMTGISVTFTDGTTATGTDSIQCEQGKVVSSIAVTMSEPVTITTGAVVTMKGTAGECATNIPDYVTYGTITAGANSSTLIIIPSGSNGTAGYAGEMTFKVAAGAVKDGTDNGCAETTFGLTVTKLLPKVANITVVFTDKTTITGTDALFCSQGQVVDKIKVTMSEPVTVTTAADGNVVTMKGTEGDCETKIPASVTYGTIALDTTDKTSKTLIITPSGNNKTAGYLGEMTFTVGDNVVYNAMKNGNDATSFALNVGLGFTDVNHNSWYFPAITYVTARGIAVGIGNGLFAPEDQITRAEFLVMLMNTFDIEPAATWTDNFSDAGSKEYYSGYLAAAKKLGLAAGIGNNKFAPNQGITREEMFTLLYRALDGQSAFTGLDKLNDLSGFKDVNGISSYALTAIKTLVTVGIVHGDDHSMLTPKAPATRAQSAQIFYSLLSQIKPK